MTIFTDKAKVYVPRLMKDLSITEVQACGIFGNLGTETGGFTALQEKKPTVAGSKGGYGWMQWTGPRRKKYEAWCKTNNLDPASDETNYRYLVQETATDEAHSLVQLRKTTSLEAATETFMKQNLRPGVPNLASRINYAKQAQLATHDVKSEVKQNTTVVGAAGGAVVACAATPTHYWPWIIGITFVILIVGLIGLHIYNEHKKEQIITTPVVAKTATGVAKKGKKNA